MAVIKYEIPVRIHSDNELATKTADFFRNKTIPWTFNQMDVELASAVTVNKTMSGMHKYELARIQRMLATSPDDENLKAEYAKLQDNTDWVYDIVASFEGEIAADIDISGNIVLFHNDTSDYNISANDMPQLDERLNSECLDDFYIEELKKFMICVIVTSVLVNPTLCLGFGNINLYIDGEKYCSETLLAYPEYRDAFTKFHEIMTSSLTFEQTLDWIKCNTNLCNEHSKPCIAFSLLTYAFNRESHESLLYSVIGLESIYTPTDRGISDKFQKRINCIFPSITKEQIKNIYNKRSKLVHGEMIINTYKDYFSFSDNGISYDDEEAQLAIALLTESIRLLIANNATKLIFNEQISYRFG